MVLRQGSDLVPHLECRALCSMPHLVALASNGLEREGSYSPIQFVAAWPVE